MSASDDGPAGLLALAERVAAQARPGEEIEAYVVRSTDTSVRVYEGAVEQLTTASSHGVGVRVVRDGRVGFAHASVLDEAALAEALGEARDNSDFATADDYSALARPDGVAPAGLDLWADEPASVAERVELALALEAAAAGLDARIVVEAADYEDSATEVAVASSTGIRAAGRERVAYVTVATLAADGDELQSGFGFAVGRCAGELDVGAAARMGVERAVRLLGGTKPRSARVTVVLDPWVTAQVLSVLSYGLSGEAVLKGRSLFADRVGEAVASPLVTLVDDPTDARAFGATAFDGEGLATRRNTLIGAGVLRGFVHNAYTGRRAGSGSTGSATRAGHKGTPGVGCVALQLAPGTASQADLLATVGDGLLVQEVAGLHSGVNPVSGDFSTGAAGLAIRGGGLGEPLREFTIASTLQRLLVDVEAVGGDVQWLPMGAAGVSLVVRDVTLSGR